MEQATKETLKEKNSRLSVSLIMVNLVLASIFATTIHLDDPDGIGSLSIIAITIIFLLGGYAFTYHGKAYRTGKWLFAIALIIGLIFFGLLWYAAQLGHAFQH